MEESKRKFIQFEKAREIIHALKLKSQGEWRIYCKSGLKPNNIPAAPDTVYKNEGWLSWNDFFGTKINWLKYEDVENIIRTFNIKTQKEYQTYCKSESKLYNIPTNPSLVYKDKGWISWGKFLRGDEKICFIIFDEAKIFVKNINLKSQKEWVIYCKSGLKPDNIPTNPNVIYKDKGWISWGDWLGTNYVSCSDREYLSFDNAREIIQNIKLSSYKEWKRWTKSNVYNIMIPKAPDQVYRNNGWISWGDFLGTGFISMKVRRLGFVSFEEAKNWFQNYNLKLLKDGEGLIDTPIKWSKFAKTDDRPSFIPANLPQTYKDDGWKGYGDFLRGNPMVEFLSFEEAKKFVKTLNLKSAKEWQQYCDSGLKPDNIPRNVSRFYTNN